MTRSAAPCCGRSATRLWFEPSASRLTPGVGRLEVRTRPNMPPFGRGDHLGAIPRDPEDGREPLACRTASVPWPLRLAFQTPWVLQYRIGSSPLAWRLWTAACRRLGWGPTCLGWHTPAGGPLAGIHLLATHPNHVWVPMGLYEPQVIRCAVRLLTQARRGSGGTDVWDVGAHRGIFSLVCARYGKGRVIALEPSPRNLAAFRMHLAANPCLADRIEVIPAAVSDVDGQTQFVIRTDGSMCQTIASGIRLWETGAGDQLTNVATLRLDTLLDQGYRPPGLVKIDVEGAEALALAGAVRLLQDCRPAVLVEVHDANAAGASLARLWSVGYQCSEITPRGLRPLDGVVPSYGHVWHVLAL